MSSNGSSGAAAGILTVAALAVIFLCLLYGVVQLSKLWKQSLIERLKKAVKRRRNFKDSFRDQNGFSWDFFMVFRVYDEDDPISALQMQHNMRSILDKLSKGGLEVRLFYSLQHKEVFCKIRAPLQRLQKHADLIDYKLPFDPEKLRTLCLAGREGQWGPLKIPEKSDMTSLSPFDHIYARFEFDVDTGRLREDLRDLFKKWPRLDVSSFLASLENGVGSDQPKADASSDNSAHNPVHDIEMSNTSLTVANAAAAAAVDVGINLSQESLYFRSVDRLKLMHLITSYHSVGGCYLDPYQLIKDECLLAYSPLHDYVELRELESEWLTLLDWPWNQPLEKIKNYFGEKIGLYFAFLGHYTTWLIPAAVVGVGIWINVAQDNNNPSAPSMPYFAGFIALWTVFMLEHWKRTEKTISMKWGTVGFEEAEQNRPQFEGAPIRSPITGKPTLYFSHVVRFYRSLFSQAVVLVMVLIVIAVIAVIFTIRIAISQSGFTIAGQDMSSIVASLLIALQIQFLNGYFGDIALRLNNHENHRTDTEYEDALIAKTFCFQFVNSFASLFYISFVKPFIQDTDPCTNNGSCMGELQTALGTIFLTRLALGNFTEVGIPLVTAWLERRKRTNEARQAQKEIFEKSGRLSAENLQAMRFVSMDSTTSSMLSRAEEEHQQAKIELSEIEKCYTMPEYHVMLGPFDDYAEMVLQFAFSTMFVASFPLAPFLSLVNNYVEIRVDGWKLCHVYRRPEPRACEDIGTWYFILESVSYCSIFVNSALVAFTSGNAINYTWTERIWIFILMSAGLLTIRQIVAFLIPDVPTEVQIQWDRQDYIVDKVLDNVEDEDDTDLATNNFIVPSYLVRGTDDDPM